MIFHRNHVRSCWRILFTRRRCNEGARSAKREAEQNDRDLRQQVHRVVVSLFA